MLVASPHQRCFWQETTRSTPKGTTPGTRGHLLQLQAPESSWPIPQAGPTKTFQHRTSPAAKPKSLKPGPTAIRPDPALSLHPCKSWEAEGRSSLRVVGRAEPKALSCAWSFSWAVFPFSSGCGFLLSPRVLSLVRLRMLRAPGRKLAFGEWG